VPREAFEAAIADDYAGFLEARSNAIQMEANRLLGEVPFEEREGREDEHPADDPLSEEASVDDDVLVEET
jgi:hypothetical protein